MNEGFEAYSTSRSMRVMGPHERTRFASDAWGHLMKLSRSGVLNTVELEHIIERALHPDRRPDLAPRPARSLDRRGAGRGRRSGCSAHHALTLHSRGGYYALDHRIYRTMASTPPARKSARKKTAAKGVGTAKTARKSVARSTRAKGGAYIPDDEVATEPGTQSLVIVESPAKAKTISKYLGRGYKVRATIGHVRDLPEKRMGIDVENGFEPEYVTIPGKEKTLERVKERGQGCTRDLSCDRS